MDFSNNIFESYFDNKITREQLLQKLGSDDPRFEETLKQELESVLTKRDGRRLEFLIYAMLLTEDELNLDAYIDILNTLLISNWHEQHENIASLLQDIHSPLSVKYLQEAIHLEPKYLNWDDNYAFEVKCIWALGYIRNKEAKEALEHIAKDTNEILAKNAKKQLEKLKF